MVETSFWCPSPRLRALVIHWDHFQTPQVDLSGPNGHFGHSGQSKVSENGPNECLIPKSLGMDTKIKSQACSEPKLHFSNLDHFVHSVQSELSEKGLNKTLGIRHQNQVYTKVTNLGILSHFEFDWPNWPFGHSK